MASHKTIGIITAGYRNHCFNSWDPSSIASGVPGSEESVIYMSQHLANLGYRVIVFGDPKPDSPYSLESANPRYVSVDFPYEEPLDVAIAWCIVDVPPRFRKLARKIYSWPHGICCNRLTPEQINGFDDVLWISQWQRSQWVAVNPSMARFQNVFGNGINPEQFEAVKERENPYSCIYGSNYGRGLNILLHLWPSVKQQFPRATLDIYYGWQHWGGLTAEDEAALRKEIPRLEALGVREHGRVGHDELNKAYGRASFWTYPCTQVETFCITGLRAQIMGAIPVTYNWGAMPETVRHGYRCYAMHDYPSLLLQAMTNAEKIPLSERKKMGEFIRKEFTWKILADRWAALFEAS